MFQKIGAIEGLYNVFCILLCARLLVLPETPVALAFIVVIVTGAVLKDRRLVRESTREEVVNGSSDKIQEIVDRVGALEMQNGFRRK